MTVVDRVAGACLGMPRSRASHANEAEQPPGGVHLVKATASLIFTEANRPDDGPDDL